MTKKIETEIAKKESEVVATNSNSIPEYLQKYADMGNIGLENIKSSDTIMPRLSIAQQMSPQVQKGDPLYIEGLEVGDFFNSISNEIYGTGPVMVTPLFQFPSRIYFPPRGTVGVQQLCGTKVLSIEGDLIEGPLNPQGCSSCEHSKFLETPRDDGSTRPDCTLFYNYVVCVHKSDGNIEPAVFSAKSKMLKPAKKWNSMMRYRVPRLPAFTMLFGLLSVAEKAPKGTFFNFAPQNAGNVNAETVKITEELFVALSNRDIKVDVRGVDRENEAEEFGEHTTEL